jgi:hypothetical protein
VLGTVLRDTLFLVGWDWLHKPLYRGLTDLIGVSTVHPDLALKIVETAFTVGTLSLVLGFVIFDVVSELRELWRIFFGDGSQPG